MSTQMTGHITGKYMALGVERVPAASGMGSSPSKAASKQFLPTLSPLSSPGNETLRQRLTTPHLLNAQPLCTWIAVVFILNTTLTYKCQDTSANGNGTTIEEGGWKQP
jgi:hypothetical protein